MKDRYAGLPEYPDKISKKKKKPKTVALVMEGNCTGCEVCVPFCPVDCIERQPQSVYSDRPIPPVQIRFDECIGCQICVKACSNLTWDAIRMVSTAEVENVLEVEFHETFEQAQEAQSYGKLDLNFVREISNTKFNKYWKK